MTHVDKLRWVGDQLDADASNKGIGQGSEGARYCWAAATEIERLQAENKQLREALEKTVIEWHDYTPGTHFARLKAALDKEKRWTKN